MKPDLSMIDLLVRLVWGMETWKNWKGLSRWWWHSIHGFEIGDLRSIIHHKIRSTTFKGRNVNFWENAANPFLVLFFPVLFRRVDPCEAALDTPHNMAHMCEKGCKKKLCFCKNRWERLVFFKTFGLHHHWTVWTNKRRCMRDLRKSGKSIKMMLNVTNETCQNERVVNKKVSLVEI